MITNNIRSAERTAAMSKQFEAYQRVIREELVPACGCTEPIAIAYVCAKAREVL